MSWCFDSRFWVRHTAIELDQSTTSYCWSCGYDLVGLDESERCPECGLPVKISTRLAPFTIASRTRKWVGVAALLGFVPLGILGFVCLRANQTKPYEGGIFLTFGIVAFVFTAFAGVAASWFMKAPSRLASHDPSTASMVFCVLLLCLGPVVLLVQGPLRETLGYEGNPIWHLLFSQLVFVLLMCALGLLSLQANMLSRRMTRPIIAQSFRQIAYIAFVAAGLAVIASPMIEYYPIMVKGTYRLASLVLGFGTLLGIGALVGWMFGTFRIALLLVRWPIGGDPASSNTTA